MAQEKDEWTPGNIKVDGGTDADKTIARARYATKVIEHILKDWSFSAVRGEQRKKLIHGIFDVMRNEKLSERRGRWRYKAKVSLSEARNRVMDALDVQNTFGADEVLVVVQPDCYTGPGITEDDKKAVYEQIRSGLSDYLARHRFRESPAAGQKNKMMKAAVELGATPSSQALHTFADQFKAPLVVSVAGKIKFERYKPGSGQYGAGFRGYFRLQAMKCQLYDRQTDTILARFTLKSDAQISVAEKSNAEAIWQSTLHEQGSVSETSEKYAQTVGWYLGAALCKRLFDRFYAMQPQPGPPAGAAKAAPRDCPGCGDKILDTALTACPACESPLPAAQVVSGGGAATTGRRAATARDYYNLRLKGFDDEDAADLVDTLQQNKDFANFKDKGMVNIFHIYNFTYVGKAMILTAVREALEDEDLDGVKITKTGNNINLLKK